MKWPVALILLAALAGCARNEGGEEAAVKSGRDGGNEAHPEMYVEEANIVELSAEAQRRAGIRVAPVEMAAVQAEVKATGSVQPIESQMVHLRSLGRARVEEVLVRVGDRVRQDEILARLDNIEAGELSTQIAGSRAELERLKIQLANAHRQAERSRSLVEIGAVPVKEAEAAETEERALEEGIRAQEGAIAGLETRLQRLGGGAGGGSGATVVRSSFAGVVLTAEPAPGDIVDPGTVLFSIVDLSRVYVEADVYEKDLGKIRTGQTAFISVDAYPGHTFEGKVAAIRAILDPQTRTASVRCELPNSDGRLRLEMFATVVIPTTDTHRALALPADAIQTVNRRQVVFVQRDPLHYEVREVQVLGDGPLSEITAGLKEREPVVVSGAFQVKSAFLARQLESEHEH